MEKRRLTIEVDGQGQLNVEHDNFTAAELATFVLVLQDLAMGVLKDGPKQSVQISSPKNSNGIR